VISFKRLSSGCRKSDSIRPVSLARISCIMSSNWDPLALRPPPHEEHLKVSFPQDHVMLITLNRPTNLNAITPQLTKDIATTLNWFDDQTSLWYVPPQNQSAKTLPKSPFKGSSRNRFRTRVLRRSRFESVSTRPSLRHSLVSFLPLTSFPFFSASLAGGFIISQVARRMNRKKWLLPYTDLHLSRVGTLHANL
jgi:hypothetical protein